MTAADPSPKPPGPAAADLRHVTSINDLTNDEIERIFVEADAFLAALGDPRIRHRIAQSTDRARGRILATLFHEPSTRTRLSFESAMIRLGGQIVTSADPATSSAAKGESLADTVRVVSNYADAIVLRHPRDGAARLAAEYASVPIINGGDGAHEHPTQALLDAFAIRHAFGTLEGLKVAICGDITHSRVARSNAALLNLFGSEVRFCAPRTLMPARAAEAFGVKVYDRLDEALRGVDVVMLLRIQNERLSGALLPSSREYARKFGVSQRHLEHASPRAIVMHPGPMNRGVEIHPALADSERSVILDQVEAGVAVRMAVLYLLAKEVGGKTPAQAARDAG
jgi:aspartate carbamoyltransferase catalytic subunit